MTIFGHELKIKISICMWKLFLVHYTEFGVIWEDLDQFKGLYIYLGVTPANKIFLNKIFFNIFND